MRAVLNHVSTRAVTLYGATVVDAWLNPPPRTGDSDAVDTSAQGREMHAQFLGMSALAGGEIRLPDEVREAVS